MGRRGRAAWIAVPVIVAGARNARIGLDRHIQDHSREFGIADIDIVGGKNASLGEMIGRLDKAGVRVPDGFATTAQAYRDFLAQDGLGGADRRAARRASMSTTSRGSRKPARASAR